MVSLITGQRVTDPTSGFRMTDRRGIELFARDYPHDYPEVEAILLMHAHRLSSCEIPVLMRPRLTGSSAISSTQSVYYMVKVLLAVFVALFRARPPIAVSEPMPPACRARDVIGRDACQRPRSSASRRSLSPIVICVLIFELIRRKHLMERYAILWLQPAVTVLVLALWKGLLTTLSHAAGISYLPSALFAVAFLFVLVMLVQFSMTDLAPVRPEHAARPAPRAAAAARRRSRTRERDAVTMRRRRAIRCRSRARRRRRAA